jgi:hypothetical protein
MPYTPRTYALAKQLDPDAFRSDESGLGARRLYALEVSDEALRHTDSAVREIITETLIYGHEAGQRALDKIMEDINMPPRTVAKFSPSSAPRINCCPGGLRKPQPKVPPMKIAMMLHFATTIGPFTPEAQRTSLAYTRFVKELLRDGLVKRPTKEQRAAYPGWAYMTTPRGDCYVEALTKIPLPV